MDGIRLGVDVGGTFTDLVAVSASGLVTAKVPSVPEDQSAAVAAAVRAGGVPAAEVVAFAHGMTVATNALLERTGARTALVTTEGFRDVIEIGRQNRASLYDLTKRRPEPLVPRDLRFTVRERVGPDGVVEPLDPASLERVVSQLSAVEVEAVAVCLLFSFLDASHERIVAEALRAALDVPVSISSEVLPEFREFERMSTTVANAYLTPALGAYLTDLGRRAEEMSLPPPLVMQSSGGVLPIEQAARRAGGCVLSGPAGGVVGAARIAGASGFADVLSFDMGGTSTDVAPILRGEAGATTETEVAGVPLRSPMVDVHTVSAGGGSIAWVDEGGALRVGPRSAGATPGPACYGRGGSDPTVTDADLYLGCLGDGDVLGGDVVLERAAAEASLARLAGRLGMTIDDTAEGVIRVANSEMVRALRVITIERGLDPRSFALVAFGGAGPMHACALAEELGISTVVVPEAGGVLSAFGLAASDLRLDDLAAYPRRLADVTPVELDEAFAPLEREAAGVLSGAVLLRRADLRYRGQSFELTIDVGELGSLEERFAAEHERRYGYRIPGEPVELVTLRLVATAAVGVPLGPALTGAARPAPVTRRPLRTEGRWVDADVFDRSGMGAGSRVTGPAIVSLAGSTCVVAAGWEGAVDAVGSLVLRRGSA